MPRKSSERVLAAKSITKQFGRIRALADVDFSASAGEIHALVGENGAGKSTLIRILTGILRPDSGQVMLNEIPLGPGSAAAALRRGIAAVYQTPMLFERMTWEENLALGCLNGWRLDLTQVTGEAQILADELGFTLPSRGTLVEELSVAQRVQLEILRALHFHPLVLILDEPTSVLSPAELQPFLQLLQRLRNQGRTVILVTHKLAEALAVADRITVLRHGRVAGEMPAGVTNEAELAQLMMGQEPTGPPSTAPERRKPGPPVVQLQQITLRSAHRLILDEVSLTLNSGSIVGIAGIDRSGQQELVEVIAGVRSPTSGSISFADQGRDPRRAIAIVPQDRDVDGLILGLSLWENLLLAPRLRDRLVSPHGWIRRSSAIQLCQELISHFSVRAQSVKVPAESLSGGNRQRFMVARTLAAASPVIVAHDICRGLDFNAAAELRARLREYAAHGGAVLLLSSDLEELFELCDRLYVLNRGRLTQVRPEQRDMVEIGLLMACASRTSESPSGG
jgi:ABC-type uncharacterized transport system ATPase subunit